MSTPEPWRENEIVKWVERELEEIRKERRVADGRRFEVIAVIGAMCVGAAIVAAGMAFGRFVL